MIAEDYFSSVADGFEFVISFFSLIGFIGILAGFGILFIGGRFNRGMAIKVIIISLIIVGITGMYTGIKYFRLGIRL